MHVETVLRTATCKPLTALIKQCPCISESWLHRKQGSGCLVSWWRMESTRKFEQWVRKTSDLFIRGKLVCDLLTAVRGTCVADFVSSLTCNLLDCCMTLGSPTSLPEQDLLQIKLLLYHASRWWRYVRISRIGESETAHDSSCCMCDKDHQNAIQILLKH